MKQEGVEKDDMTMGCPVKTCEGHFVETESGANGGQSRPTSTMVEFIRDLLDRVCGNKCQLKAPEW